jgi:hypothetical protein
MPGEALARDAFLSTTLLGAIELWKGEMRDEHATSRN